MAHTCETVNKTGCRGLLYLTHLGAKQAFAEVVQGSAGIRRTRDGLQQQQQQQQQHHNTTITAEIRYHGSMNHECSTVCG